MRLSRAAVLPCSMTRSWQPLLVILTVIQTLFGAQRTATGFQAPCHRLRTLEPCIRAVCSLAALSKCATIKTSQQQVCHVRADTNTRCTLLGLLCCQRSSPCRVAWLMGVKQPRECPREACHLAWRAYRNNGDGRRRGNMPACGRNPSPL